MTNLYSSLFFLPLPLSLPVFLNLIKQPGFSDQEPLCHVADLWFIMSSNETGGSSQIK